ncbi:hypothetical protein TSUD_41100 [Trifolium subterraneum]|nr:hypothetical protein TSUD_41100 [Trifolium subterraneum]
MSSTHSKDSNSECLTFPGAQSERIQLVLTKITCQSSSWMDVPELVARYLRWLCSTQINLDISEQRSGTIQ